MTRLSGRKQLIEVPGDFTRVVTFMDRDKGIIWGDFNIGQENRKIFVPRGRYLVRLRRPDGKLYLAECNVTTDRQSATWEKFKVISEAQDPLKGKRVRHHWMVRFSGDVLLSPDNTAIREANFGGSLAIIARAASCRPMALRPRLSAGLPLSHTSYSFVCGSGASFRTIFRLIFYTGKGNELVPVR